MVSGQLIRLSRDVDCLHKEEQADRKHTEVEAKQWKCRSGICAFVLEMLQGM